MARRVSPMCVAEEIAKILTLFPSQQSKR